MTDPHRASAGHLGILLPDRPVALVLGSFPGADSLRQGQYYAHPRNRFWPLIGTVTGVPGDAPYGERVRGAMAAGLAVWDVLASCSRPGSLDTSIARGSEVPNDVAALIAAHPSIAVIGCNGRAAATFFERHVLTHCKGRTPPPHVPLPSTSPANAAFSLEALRRAWEPVLGRLRGR